MQAAETEPVFTPAMAVDHYENFPVGSIVLPARLRRPVALIYRFAREADDFADEGDVPAHVRLERLDEFRREIDRIQQGQAPAIPWFATLAEVIHQYQLPPDAFRDLLSAFAQDVTKVRYADYGEVLDYCRRSANPVGRLMLHLYGEPSRQNLAHSDAICSALQLVNFLQDIAIDYRKGRLYLPQDELRRFGISEHDIASGVVDDSWRHFVTFQIERTRALLCCGAPLGRTFKGRVGVEMRMIIAGGDRILTKIARIGGDVFRRRPVLRPLDWPLLLVRALR
jgi:squalene synthase HpnC